MRIRSLQEVTQFLEGELAWRKRELTTLKLMVPKSRSHERALWARAAICVLYAHWEGFVLAAANCYISFVAAQGLKFSDLTPNFVALGLRKEISRAGESNKHSLRTELTRSLILGLSADANIDRDYSVDVNSNLNGDQFSEILCLLGLEHREFLLKKPLLDQQLLSPRNQIAHGNKLDIPTDDYIALHDEVVQLIDSFRNQVENAAVQQQYRR